MPSQIRWLTPDPYNGSYQLTNPQSLNRYAYVSGQPLAYTDPSGLNMFGLIPPEAGLGNIWAEGIILGVDLFADLFSLFRHHDPPFHGSLKPRPSSSIADFPDGESLGMPTGMNANFGGVMGAILPSNVCPDVGPCVITIMDAAPNGSQQTFSCPAGTTATMKRMLVTGYENSFRSTGKNPGDKGYGLTANQQVAGPGTIAAPKTYPFGTQMYVPGYGPGTVADRGGAIKNAHIDVWFSTTQRAIQWGAQHLTVTICK